MYKVKCYNPIAKVGLDLLGDNFEVIDGNDAEIALVRSAKLHDENFGDQMLAIARAGAGVNNIPLDRCAEEGIVVFNTPGANANAVKELVLAGMIMASRNIIKANRWVEANLETPNLAKEVEANKKQFVGNEVIGKKVGVIGLGAIGIEVANACYTLGMEVVGYDPYVSIQNAFKLARQVHYTKNLDDVLTECDYITIHTPLVDETREIFNATNIKKMKDGVVILNFARNEMVNAEDMKKALKDGKVKYYVTDFANEDTKDFVNVIATPHLGASTAEAEDNCAIMAAKEIRDFIENGNIENSVNYPACDMGPAGENLRLTILHKNVTGMLGQFTGILANTDVNIANLTNKSRGDFAYTMMDLDTKELTDAVIEELKKVDGVIRVRVIG